MDNDDDVDDDDSYDDNDYNNNNNDDDDDGRWLIGYCRMIISLSLYVLPWSVDLNMFMCHEIVMCYFIRRDSDFVGDHLALGVNRVGTGDAYGS